MISEWEGADHWNGSENSWEWGSRHRGSQEETRWVKWLHQSGGVQIMERSTSWSLHTTCCVMLRSSSVRPAVSCFRVLSCRLYEDHPCARDLYKGQLATGNWRRAPRRARLRSWGKSLWSRWVGLREQWSGNRVLEELTLENKLWEEWTFFCVGGSVEKAKGGFRQSCFLYIDNISSKD